MPEFTELVNSRKEKDARQPNRAVMTAPRHHALPGRRRGQRQLDQPRVAGEEAVRGVRNVPEREAERSGVQVMLHAVVAHHDIVQRQAVAEAAADAVISR